MAFEGDWKPTKRENPHFKCRDCHSDNVWYIMWESFDGGHEDIKYHCRSCNKTWWIEGPDY